MAWSALGSIAGGLIGGGLSMAGGMMANSASAKEAAKQREWQERMSNTAHQRQVADLRAAGLNPILSAFGNGAQVGSGSAATIVNPYQGAGQIMSSAASAAGTSYAAVKQARVAERQLDEINKGLATSTIEKNRADVALAGEQVKTNLTQQQLNSAAAARQMADADAAKAVARLHAASAVNQYAQAQYNSALTAGVNYDNRVKSYREDVQNFPLLFGRVGHAASLLDIINPFSKLLR